MVIRCIRRGLALLPLFLLSCPLLASAQAVPVTVISRAELEAAPRLQITSPLVLYESADTVRGINGPTTYHDGEGHLYVVLRNPGRILQLDAEGGEIATVPIRTRGGGIAVARDTFAVLEMGQGPRPEPGGVLSLESRIRLYSPAGDELSVATFDRSRVPFDTAQVFVRALQATDAGWFATLQVNPLRRDPGVMPSMATLVRLDPTTFEIDSLHTAVNLSNWSAAGGWGVPREMEYVPSYAVADDGRIYLHGDDAYTIEVGSAEGVPLHRIEADPVRIPYTDAQFQARLERRIEESSDREYAEILREYAPAIGHSDQRPLLGRIVPGRNGRFLVQRRDLGTLDDGWPNIWDVLDIEEGIVGRLHTPDGAFVTHFQWPYIFVAFTRDRANARVRYEISSVEKSR